MARTSTTSSAAWVDAAYQCFEREGLSAIRVEAIARELGATKGSFYWHFTSRKALVNAVVDRWEQEATEALIHTADAAGKTPESRIVALYKGIEIRDHRTGGGEATLYRDARIEGVADAVSRVSQRRIAYLAGLIAETGVNHTEADTRSLIALSGLIGIQQLALIGDVGLVSVEMTTLFRTALAMTLHQNDDQKPLGA